jgi:hypothetical protein
MKLKEHNFRISELYEKNEEEIERCHDQIARQASQNHNLQQKMEELENQLDQMSL